MACMYIYIYDNEFMQQYINNPTNTQQEEQISHMRNSQRKLMKPSRKK